MLNEKKFVCDECHLSKPNEEERKVFDNEIHVLSFCAPCVEQQALRHAKNRRVMRITRTAELIIAQQVIKNGNNLARITEVVREVVARTPLSKEQAIRLVKHVVDKAHYKITKNVGYKHMYMTEKGCSHVRAIRQYNIGGEVPITEAVCPF